MGEQCSSRKLEAVVVDSHIGGSGLMVVFSLTGEAVGFGIYLSDCMSSPLML